MDVKCNVILITSLSNVRISVKKYNVCLKYFRYSHRIVLIDFKTFYRTEAIQSPGA